MPKRVIFVIAPNDFRDEELLETKKVLDNNGIETAVASKTGNPSKGMLGTVVDPEYAIHQINPDEWDGIVFVGGVGASVYFDDPVALRLAKEFYEKRKIVAAICIAPSILVNAGILIGKKATAWPSERNNINGVGTYTGADVEIDGNIITGNGPKAAKKFGEAILSALRKTE